MCSTTDFIFKRFASRLPQAKCLDRILRTNWILIKITLITASSVEMMRKAQVEAGEQIRVVLKVQRSSELACARVQDCNVIKV